MLQKTLLNMEYINKSLFKSMFYSVEYYDTIDSTNNLVYGYGTASKFEGLVVIAENQTKGKGRLGRNWHSSYCDNLCFSILLRPDIPTNKSFLIPFICGIAGRKAFSSFNLETHIKWPNDLIVSKRKIAGFLSELRTVSNSIDFIVAGCGFNLNSSVSSFSSEIKEKATSFFIEKSEIISRENFLLAFLQSFEGFYIKLLNNNYSSILNSWKEGCNLWGEMVSINTGFEIVDGVATDIDEHGGLMIDTRNGMKTVCTGDVFLINTSKE